MNNRFDQIIVKRNHERLEKTKEYYSLPEHQRELSPKHWESLKAAFENEHDLVVYAADYFILRGRYRTEIKAPIFQGMDVDDLFYFFDPDYIINNLSKIPEIYLPTDPTAPIDPFLAVKPFLISIYAKYRVLEAAGMETATNFDMTALDRQIEIELQKEKYNGIGYDLFVHDVQTNQSDITTTDLYDIIEEALLSLQRISQAIADRQADLPSIRYNNSSNVSTITDKLTNVFFSLAAPAPKGHIEGQREMIPLKYERDGSNKEITLFYDYVYNEDMIKAFGLSKKFDDFDFFVMSICDNLYTENNCSVSLSKIWREIGNEGTPNTEQLTNVLDSLRKGMSTIITIDDSEVQRAWNDPNGTYKEIISPAIPVQISSDRFIANGKVADGTVLINSISPFGIVARGIGHYSTWSKEILTKYKGRKTKRYYSVLRFLILQIGWMKNEKSERSHKILYSSLYDHTGDKTTRAKQLTREMMFTLLDDVFIPTGYVRAYKEDTKGKPGVIFTLDNSKQITKKHQKRISKKKA